MQIIDEIQTQAALPFKELINALAEGFVNGCCAPQRHHHTIKSANAPDATLLLMPAWDETGRAERYLGVKLVGVFPGNSAKRLPSLTSTYLLFDGDTGQLLALIDGNVITGRRTAATAALGAKLLARPEARTLAVLGSGRVASLIPEAMRTVRSIEEVTVWDIDSEGAERLAGQLRRTGLQARSTGSIEEAAGNADIISAATLSTAPLLRKDWIQSGTHVDLIGSFTPTMREADDELIGNSLLFVDTMDALHESGDLVQPIKSGALRAENIAGTLADLCRGDARGRADVRQITLFKAVGSSLADLVAARQVYQTALRESAPL